MNDSPTIAIVTGAVRPGNFSGKAAALLRQRLERQEMRVEHVDPASLVLPPPGTGEDSPAVAELRAALGRADGVLLVTPEYQGSFSSVLKLVLEHLGWPAEIAGKPVALVGVAAGRLGAIKSLEHLRSVCAHLGAHVLPTAVSIPRVETVFDEDGSVTDAEILRALDALCRALADETRRRRSFTRAA